MSARAERLERLRAASAVAMLGGGLEVTTYEDVVRAPPFSVLRGSPAIRAEVKEYTGLQEEAPWAYFEREPAHGHKVSMELSQLGLPVTHLYPDRIDDIAPDGYTGADAMLDALRAGGVLVKVPDGLAVGEARYWCCYLTEQSAREHCQDYFTLLGTNGLSR